MGIAKRFFITREPIVWICLFKRCCNGLKRRKKDGGVQEFHIFFHNLKGFDGVFIMNSLYKLNFKVSDIMGTGTKMLHFKHKNLIFKDSLSLLNMPLANFTKTFALVELKKDSSHTSFPSSNICSMKDRFQI